MKVLIFLSSTIFYSTLAFSTIGLKCDLVNDANRWKTHIEIYNSREDGIAFVSTYSEKSALSAQNVARILVKVTNLVPSDHIQLERPYIKYTSTSADKHDTLELETKGCSQQYPGMIRAIATYYFYGETFNDVEFNCQKINSQSSFGDPKFWKYDFPGDCKN
jgi:hypothetical protein